MILSLYAHEYAVCHLAANADEPAWPRGAFTAVTRTPHELSVVCAAVCVPSAVTAERGWRVLEVQGPLPFTTVGVLAGIALPLAEARVSIFAVSTYDTDYILVKHPDLERAIGALVAAGHQVERPPA